MDKVRFEDLPEHIQLIFIDTMERNKAKIKEPGDK